MKILGIETSCDETAVAIVEAEGGFDVPKFRTVAEALNSQTKIHEKYGGVYPMMAKREHSKNLIPLLKKIVEELGSKNPAVEIRNEDEIKIILEREPELLKQFIESIPSIP